VHDVNGKIAKAVKENFGLKNLPKRNKKPRSFLIQSFEQFKTAKTLLTILMLCGAICGYAQETPPFAASTKTWTFGDLTWSDAIHVPACNKASFTKDNDNPQCRSYTGSGKTWYYYNWAYVNENAATLCPLPWRVPSLSDINSLVSNTDRSTLFTLWGVGGKAFGNTFEGESTTGYLWSTTVNNRTTAYMFYYGSNYRYMSYYDMRYGYQVRCVID
jgi:hypothetical protein